MTPDSIPESEIQKEMELVRGGSDFYAISLGLVGGGVAAGVVLGSSLARKERRAEAIRRIRARRAQTSPPPP